MLLECQIHNESFMVAVQEQCDFLVYLYYVHNSVAVKCIKFVIKKMVGREHDVTAMSNSYSFWLALQHILQLLLNTAFLSIQNFDCKMLLLNMKSLIVNCLAEDVMFPECQIPIIIING